MRDNNSTLCFHVCLIEKQNLLVFTQTVQYYARGNHIVLYLKITIKYMEENQLCDGKNQLKTSDKYNSLIHLNFYLITIKHIYNTGCLKSLREKFM